MDSLNITGLNFPDEAHASAYASPLEPMYTQHKPAVRGLMELPKAVLYLLMAAVVVVGVAYAIVGHLIKDLAIDIVECVLGPVEDDEEQEKDVNCAAKSRHVWNPALFLSRHNAFHVWDQDGVVVPLPPEDSPQASPLLLAALPHIHSLFHSHGYGPAALTYIPSLFSTHSNTHSPAAPPNTPGPLSALPTAV